MIDILDDGGEFMLPSEFEVDVKSEVIILGEDGTVYKIIKESLVGDEPSVRKIIGYLWYNK